MRVHRVCISPTKPRLRAMLLAAFLAVALGVCVRVPLAYADITIWVGYSGGPYYEKAVWEDSVIEANSLEFEYSSMDAGNFVRKAFGKGMLLTDIVEGADIDSMALERFYLGTGDNYVIDDGVYGRTGWSFYNLAMVTRYYFDTLPECLTSDGSGEYVFVDGMDPWADAWPVPTILAYESSFDRVPIGEESPRWRDKSNMRTLGKYRLLFGQTDPLEQTSADAAHDVHSLTCILAGIPDISFDTSEIAGKVGETYVVSPIISATDVLVEEQGIYDIRWKSSNEDVMTVTKNDDGTISVTIVGEGTANLEAEFGDSPSDEFIATSSLGVSGTGTNSDDNNNNDDNNNDNNNNDGNNDGTGDNTGENAGGNGGGTGGEAGNNTESDDSQGNDNNANQGGDNDAHTDDNTNQSNTSNANQEDTKAEDTKPNDTKTDSTKTDSKTPSTPTTSNPTQDNTSSGQDGGQTNAGNVKPGNNQGSSSNSEQQPSADKPNNSSNTSSGTQETQQPAGQAASSSANNITDSESSSKGNGQASSNNVRQETKQDNQQDTKQDNQQDKPRPSDNMTPAEPLLPEQSSTQTPDKTPDQTSQPADTDSRIDQADNSPDPDQTTPESSQDNPTENAEQTQEHEQESASGQKDSDQQNIAPNQPTEDSENTSSDEVPAEESQDAATDIAAEDNSGTSEEDFSENTELENNGQLEEELSAASQGLAYRLVSKEGGDEGSDGGMAAASIAQAMVVTGALPVWMLLLAILACIIGGISSHVVNYWRQKDHNVQV